MEMTNCGNCGQVNQPNMAFCTNCGHSISAIREAQINTVPKLDAMPAAARAAGKGKSRLWIGGLIGCFGLVMIAGVAIIGAGLYAGSLRNENTRVPTPDSADSTPAPVREEK